MLLLIIIAVGLIIWIISQQHNSSSRSSRLSSGRAGRQVSSSTGGASRADLVQMLPQVFGNPPYKVIDIYKTSDGTGTRYVFSFERQRNGTWRAYIEDQPGYGTRKTGLVETHRLSDGGRKYVCWKKEGYAYGELPTLEEAKAIAALWSDKTQEYMRTGVQF